MKTLITLLLMTSLNVFGQENLNQQDLCGYYGSEDKVIYDYNYRMGPEKTQADTGACYAFSVAALLEEDFYLQLIGKVPNSTFENNISVIDVQRCDMEAGHGLGYETLMDYAAYAMECVLYKGGACFAKYAPFETLSKISFTTQSQRFLDFISIYDEWKLLDKKHNNDAERLGFFDEKTDYFWNYLTKDNKDPIGGSGFSFTHFVKSFYTAKNDLHFLNLLLTTDDCKKNRYKFENRKYVTENYYQRNFSSKIPYRKEKMEIIKKNFKNNRSSLVVLFNPTHVAVISGMRMSDGVCQFYLRSSYPFWASHVYSNSSNGQSGWYSGWMDAVPVITNTISIKYLKETTTEDYTKDKELFNQKDIAKSYKEEKLYDSPDKW